MYSPVNLENEPIPQQPREKQRLTMLISLALLIGGLIIGAAVSNYVRDSTRRWFKECLSLDLEHNISHWTNADLDRKLYKLSRWEEFTSIQFKSFVAHQILGLGLSYNETFHFLEAGVGVGAFAREILHVYPNSTGIGFDIEEEAVAIANLVLPQDRMQVFVCDMLDLSHLESDSFNYVLIPGSLCYLHSLIDVKSALKQLTRVLKPGGGLCASMLASATSNTGSCNVRIPKTIWKTLDQLKLITLEEMDDWGLPHSSGRYAVCLRKHY
jgi:SAM-dependent methyltransferase